jgi:uncharacterized Tic20 family protein
MSDQYPQNPQADQTQAYGQQPQPTYQGQPSTMSAQDERTWGAISHAGAVVAMVCSAGFLGFLASLAVYFVYKDRGPFVRAHAANSINVQISMFIWLVVAGIAYVILGLVTLGIGFVVFLPVFAVPFVVAGVLHVIGAVKAYNGEWWNPPLTPQLVR